MTRRNRQHKERQRQKLSLGSIFEKTVLRVLKNRQDRAKSLARKLLASLYEKSTCQLIVRQKDHLITNETSQDFSTDCAIVIQGPIDTKDDFTYQTVLQYRAFYPLCPIIVSTWDGPIGQAFKNRCSGISNCVVLLNSPPEHTGLYNFNYQVVSSINGIHKAKVLGARYVIKTRSDQRMNKRGLLTYFKLLLSLFPVSSQNSLFPNQSAQSRIIFLGTTVPFAKLIPFFAADFFQFGDVNDLLDFYSVELSAVDDNTKLRFERENSLKLSGMTVGNYFLISAETTLLMNYAKGFQNKITYTVQDYWSFIKTNLIFVNYSDLELFWDKYQAANNEFNTISRPQSLETIYPREGFDFASWLKLMNGFLSYRPEYESLSNEPLSFVLGPGKESKKRRFF